MVIPYLPAGDISIPPALWAQAEVLAVARNTTSAARSGAHRDRGIRQNVLGHLVGSLAELVVFHAACEAGDKATSADLLEGMFHPGGGAFVKGSDALSVDIKTFDCEDRKRYLAINAEKHAALYGQVTHYLCLVVPLYGRQARVCWVPYAQVGKWHKSSLGAYGDPSHNLAIHLFLLKYGGEIALETLRSKRYAFADIQGARETARGEMFRLIPSLSNHL